MKENSLSQILCDDFGTAQAQIGVLHDLFWDAEADEIEPKKVFVVLYDILHKLDRVEKALEALPYDIVEEKTIEELQLIMKDSKLAQRLSTKGGAQ